MGGTYLYICLPESDPPTTQWSKVNTEFLESEVLREYFSNLELTLAAIKKENYYGRYDALNVEIFLRDPDVLDDCYPSPARTILREILREFHNWRDSITLPEGKDFFIFGQAIHDHSLCSIAEHSNFCDKDENVALFNYKALTINDDICITSDHVEFHIANLLDSPQLTSWFVNNRIPSRLFHDTKKHPENNGIPWQGASALKCGIDAAQNLLNSAVGESSTLYNFDSVNQAWIKFMFDNAYGDNGELLYHGYHLDIDSVEVPSAIKKMFK